MRNKDKHKAELLEDELQALFNSTVGEVEVERLNRLARYSAEIPKTSSPWCKPIVQHIGATLCLLLGLIFFSVNTLVESSQSWSPQAASKDNDYSETVEYFPFQAASEWDFDGTKVGFDLLHGGNEIDEDLLEASFRALLDKQDKQ